MVALLAVGGSAAAVQGPGPGPGPVSGGGAGASTLDRARAAIEALPHSPQLLSELAKLGSHEEVGGRISATSMAGIDVASFQHPHGDAIDWGKVAGDGYKFAAVKGTEGDYYVNPWARGDLAAAQAAGLFVTAYHFAIPDVSGGAEQAQFAVQNSGYVPGGHMLPLMLDIEYDPYVAYDHTNECYGLSHANMTAWIAAFVAAARSLTGQFPIIYTTADWWDKCTGASIAFGADPMWVAAYGDSSPPMPAGWGAWTFWQYTSSGTVPGVDTPGGTDLSDFDAGLIDLINPGSQQSRAGSSVALPINALAAPAGQPFSYTAAGLPPGLAINKAGVISGAVRGADATYQVTVSAANAAAAAGEVSFSWQVAG